MLDTRVESIPTAAKETPYMSPRVNETKSAAVIMKLGRSVADCPNASPERILRAGLTTLLFMIN